MAVIEGGGLVLLPGEARTIEESGFEVAVYGTRQVTGGAYSLIETKEQEAGSGPPLHIHRDAAESFYVIDGAYSMHLAGRDFECPAGSYIYVPRGTPHTFRVLTRGSRKLNLYTPSAMEGYFEDLSEALARGVDEAGLAEIGERYAMEILGPAPEGYLEDRQPM